MPEITPQTGIIIVDHGSRRAEANAMLDMVASEFAARTGALIVEPAHMELAAPGIGDAFARCVSRGALHVVVCLYFLSPGRHSREDIPALVEAAAAQHPGISWSITQPLGIDPRIADLMHDRIREALPS